jgi:hypothetical protein
MISAMTSINWKRVISCGIFAGVIINISGMMLVGLVLGEEYVNSFKAKFPSSSEAVMFVQHVGLRLWFGVLAVQQCGHDLVPARAPRSLPQ